MEVIEKGVGDPEYGVLACVHGDEPEGKKAIEKLLNSGTEFKKPVKFVIANEEALKENERFLDVDLNRSFPGDPESDKHEERLASKLVNELEGLKVFDMHSTRSEPTPFAIIKERKDPILGRLKSTGLKRACMFEEESGATPDVFDCVGIEVGPQGTDQAAKKCFEILVNYLAAEGVIEGKFQKSDPEIFRYFETVDGGNWEFEAENFSKIEKGEVFAKAGTTELVSTEEFYPILMSTDGYDDILGHKAEKLGRASELI